MNELILYTTEDGRSQIKLRTDQQTAWLTQFDMAELFDASKQNISLHQKNIFQDGELDTAAVVKDSLTAQFSTPGLANSRIAIWATSTEGPSAVHKCE